MILYLKHLSLYIYIDMYIHIYIYIYIHILYCIFGTGMFELLLLCDIEAHTLKLQCDFQQLRLCMNVHLSGVAKWGQSSWGQFENTEHFWNNLASTIATRFPTILEQGCLNCCYYIILKHIHWSIYMYSGCFAICASIWYPHPHSGVG